MRKTRAHTTVRKTSILIKRRKTLNRGTRRRIARRIHTNLRISRRMRTTKSIKIKVTQESITSSNLTAKIMKTKTNLKMLIIARSS